MVSVLLVSDCNCDVGLAAEQEAERREELRREGTEPDEIAGQGSYRPRRLRENALVWMEQGVHRRFMDGPLTEDLIAPDLDDEGLPGGGGVGVSTIEKMTVLRDDIHAIYDDIVPCFPPDFCTAHGGVMGGDGGAGGSAAGGDGGVVGAASSADALAEERSGVFDFYVRLYHKMFLQVC
eukprot:SAG11_NODE_4921_length_1722_cov_1.110906_1_plen_178_part_10